MGSALTIRHNNAVHPFPTFSVFLSFYFLSFNVLRKRQTYRNINCKSVLHITLWKANEYRKDNEHKKVVNNEMRAPSFMLLVASRVATFYNKN